MEKSYPYPPYHYLKEVLTNCPKAGLLYMQLWAECDGKLTVKVKKKDVLNKFLCSATKLRNDAILLVREGFVNMNATMMEYRFELTGWDDVEKEDEDS